MTAFPSPALSSPERFTTFGLEEGAGLGELASRSLPSQVSAGRRMPLGQG